jgi:hypothetical protein
VKVAPDGWQIVSRYPEMFSREAHQAPQCEPCQGGDIDRIFKYVRVKEADRLLFKAYLVACLVPDVPRPVLVFHGEKGASKSTTFEVLKRLIDPSKLSVVSMPRDVPGLLQQLSHHYWLGFDNVSYLPGDMSDVLCQAVTGGSFSKRTLFSNDEDFIGRFKCCVALNGISCVVNRSDLLDRSILIEGERIPEGERKEAAALWVEFEQDRPLILGAMFDALAVGMRNYDAVKLRELPRMADFAHWGYAIALAWGGDMGDEFLERYRENIGQQNQQVIESDPVAACLVEFMESRGGAPWEGRASELFAEIKGIAETIEISTRAKGFPQQANQFANRLNGVRSNLEQYGITFESWHGRRGTVIKINMLSLNSRISSSPSSPSTQGSNIKAVRRDDDRHTIVTPSSRLKRSNAKACDDGDDGDDDLHALRENNMQKDATADGRDAHFADGDAQLQSASHLKRSNAKACDARDARDAHLHTLRENNMHKDATANSETTAKPLAARQSDPVHGMIADGEEVEWTPI